MRKREFNGVMREREIKREKERERAPWHYKNKTQSVSWDTQTCNNCAGQQYKYTYGMPMDLDQ